jgi:hypothetical protein
MSGQDMRLPTATLDPRLERAPPRPETLRPPSPRPRRSGFAHGAGTVRRGTQAKFFGR